MGKFFIAGMLTSVAIACTPGNDQSNDCAKFVRDVTIPDGTALQSGTTQPKTWEVTNCGDTPWDNRYHLVRVYGEGEQPYLRQAAPASVEMPPVKPGKNGEVTVQITVPPKEGQWLILFELEKSEKSRFGDPLWVSFKTK